MERRLAVGTAVVALVVLLGGLLAVGAVPCGLVSTQPACELALTPGPIEDTFGLVSVDGATTYPSAGRFLLTTVAVREDLDLASWWQARRAAHIDTVPREELYPSGSDRDDVNEQNVQLMVDSQLAAARAGLAALGYDVRGQGAEVLSVEEGAVTEELVVGDVVVAIDGERVEEAQDAVALVRDRGPGDELTLAVRRDDEEHEVRLTLGANPHDPDAGYIGVLLTTAVELPVEVSFDAGIIGGPSAGLMFALTLVDLLGPEDLTGGTVVAGTGTITTDGVVGPVGGIRQKVVGATTAHGTEEPASAFLVPRGNLEEARRAPVANDVLLVPVGTLDDALLALEAIARGQDPAGALLLAAGG